MFDLKIKEIKRICETDEVLKLSEMADNQGVVREIKITYIPHGKYYSIHGICHQFDMVYDTYLVFDERTETIMQYHCSCHEEGVCEHVGAVMLRLLDIEATSFPYKYKAEAPLKAAPDNDADLKALFEKYEDTKDAFRLIDPKALIQVDMLGTQEYRFSVGHERMYIVQNHTDFFERVRKQSSFRYGQSLTLRHAMSQFTPFSQMILNANVFDVVEDRVLSVRDEHMDHFFDILSKVPDKNRTFALAQWDKPIEVETETEDDFVTLHWPRFLKDHVVTQKAIYFSEDKLLFQFNTPQARLMSDVMNTVGHLTVEGFHDLARFLQAHMPEVFVFKPQPAIDDVSMVSVYCDINELGHADITVFGTHQTDEQVNGFQADVYPTLSFVSNLVRFNTEYITEGHQAVIESPETLERFITEALPVIEKFATVYTTEAFVDVQQGASMKMSLSLIHQEGRLKLHIDALDFPREELVKLYESYLKGQIFHRLESGDLVKIDQGALEALGEFADMMGMSVDDIANEAFELDASRFYTFQAYQTKSTRLQMQEATPLEPIEHEITGVTAPILRDYQKEGVLWFQSAIHYGLGGILADDMGLGKTLQTLSVIDQYQGQEPALIIAPATVLYNWVQEATQFTPHLQMLVVQGDAQEREAMLKTIDQYDVVLTSYDYLKRDIEQFHDHRYGLMFIDEAQMIKNPRSQVSKAVKSIQAKHRFALSGTPLENRLSELWSLFDYVMPGYLYTYPRFASEFEVPIVKHQDPQAQKLLQAMVRPFILRRLKKDVLGNLPQKVSKVIEIEKDETFLKIYQSHMVAIQDAMRRSENRVSILAHITKLRQICLDPRLIHTDLEAVPSKKLEKMVELVKAHDGEKILIFSSFTKGLDLIEDTLDDQGIRYHRFDGTTSKEARRDMIAEFQKDDVPVFLISLKAGGTGINLTAASVVIHMDPWWNSSVQNQATDRVYRMGQTQDVVEYSLVMDQTIESQILVLQKDKQDLADRFVEGHDGSITTMQWDDLVTLFQRGEA